MGIGVVEERWGERKRLKRTSVCVNGMGYDAIVDWGGSKND